MNLSVFLNGCSIHKRHVKNKNKAQLYLEIGTNHLTRGQPPQALKALLKAESLDPKNSSIHNNLGLAYMVQNKYEKAIFHMKKSIDLNSQNTEAYNNLGRILIQMGLYKKALVYLKKASLDLTYTQPQIVWTNMGLAYFYQHQYISALNSFSKAVSLNKNNCVALNWYGRSLYVLKRFHQATQAYAEVIDLCQGEILEEAHYYKGLSYHKLGGFEQAILHLKKAVQTRPKGKYAQRAQRMLRKLR